MLFDRVASLIVGGVELDGLRFAFSIQKGATKSPNKCTLRIWNMTEWTRSKVEKIGAVVFLRAGYKRDVGAVAIFSGNVARSLTVREGPDWITEIELLDGLLEFRDAKISIALNAGATTGQALRQVSATFGLAVRPLPADIDTKQYPSGFAFVGRVRDAMDRICEFAGLEWSIQNREIQVVKKGGVFQRRAILLSPETGMVGSPAQEAKTMTEKGAAKAGVTSSQAGVRRVQRPGKDGNAQEALQVQGYKITSLLQPTIEPGGYVQVRSAGIDGQFFRVEEVQHDGDTHGNEWHSVVSLRFV